MVYTIHGCYGGYSFCFTTHWLSNQVPNTLSRVCPGIFEVQDGFVLVVWFQKLWNITEIILSSILDVLHQLRFVKGHRIGSSKFQLLQLNARSILSIWPVNHPVFKLNLCKDGCPTPATRTLDRNLFKYTCATILATNPHCRGSSEWCWNQPKGGPWWLLPTELFRSSWHNLSFEGFSHPSPASHPFHPPRDFRRKPILN